MALTVNAQRPAPNSLAPNYTLLHATSALPVSEGQINAAGGTIGDSALTIVIILASGTAATLTIAGIAGEDGTARNVVFTGSTTTDTVYLLSTSQVGGLVNTFAAMTLTASVADKVLVGLRPV